MTELLFILQKYKMLSIFHTYFVLNILNVGVLRERDLLWGYGYLSFDRRRQKVLQMVTIFRR